MYADVRGRYSRRGGYARRKFCDLDRSRGQRGWPRDLAGGRGQHLTVRGLACHPAHLGGGTHHAPAGRLRTGAGAPLVLRSGGAQLHVTEADRSLSYDWRLDAIRTFELAVEFARDGHEGLRHWFPDLRCPAAFAQAASIRGRGNLRYGSWSGRGRQAGIDRALAPAQPPRSGRAHRRLPHRHRLHGIAR